MNKEDNIFDSLSLDKLLDQRNKIPLKKYMFGNTTMNNLTNGGLESYLYIVGTGHFISHSDFMLQIAHDISLMNNQVLVLYIDFNNDSIRLVSNNLSRESFKTTHKLTSEDVLKNENKEIVDNIISCIGYTTNINIFSADLDFKIHSLETMINDFTKKSKDLIVFIDSLENLGTAFNSNLALLKQYTKDFNIPIILSSFLKDSYSPIFFDSFQESEIEYISDYMICLQYKTIELRPNLKKHQAIRIINNLNKSTMQKRLSIFTLKNRFDNLYESSVLYQPKYHNFYFDFNKPKK